MNKNAGVAEVSQAYLIEAAERAVPIGYKQTEAGVIPEDWILSTVGEHTSWMSGGTPDRANEAYWRGTIPWISGSTLKKYLISTSDQFLTESGVASGSKMAPLNSVLLLVRGSALHKEIRAGMAIAPVAFNQDVKALVPLKQLDSKYLTFFILAMEDKLLNLVSSAGNSAGVLDTILVKNFTLLLPSIKEQTVIANALSDVDALLSELEKLIAKKQAIKTATMQQLLTGRTRLPQFALREDGSPKGYKQSELGEVPEDWEAKSLGDLVEIYSGESPSKFKFLTSGIPYFKVEQLNNGAVYADSTPYFIDTSKVVIAGSVIFPKRGASMLSNKIRVLKKASFMDTNLMALTCSAELSELYLYNQLTYKGLDSVADTTSIPQINNKHIIPFLIPYPSRAEQTAIATILSDMDTEIQALEQRLNKTHQIKQGMMHELLTGRTRAIREGVAVVGQQRLDFEEGCVS